MNKTKGCLIANFATVPKQEDVELRRWRLLRSATLSKERITEEAQRFLEMVYGEE
uniref:Transposon Tn7 transposition protein tnsD n=1 Tax=Klebsiella pneumoniae TaxID=573 RepID=A0A2S1JGJ6_KLEPN|nr:Transposon Tn7 transposition protein tnsD [Klebsiella pneumoniae]